MFSTRHFITLMVLALILVSQSFTTKMENKDAKDVKEAFDKMFSTADENKDGQLSKEEESKCAQTFRQRYQPYDFTLEDDD